ncbi:hypothetical protein DQM68_10520 [Leptospira mayottensis]|uniref:Phosphotyrosine protein phosphatase I domain-containing protein n=1 Tax=Leptospira mayottensis TaxID=1137606 RepID=A0ABM7DWS3_9LEPT|nr:hypothetical protein DQM68_10520 [Leptospira mayottensis]AXR65690.1 hypothetical protein DQM28_17215 [Leptospira mayottensis]AZQ02511.1 hypothetical protein LEP1GSC190_11170 [Leptospira mayottensis 200901116]
MVLLWTKLVRLCPVQKQESVYLTQTLKLTDPTEEVSKKYIETCETIAREILFVFQNLKE